jgi:uncharacterized membrane protein
MEHALPGQRWPAVLLSLTVLSSCCIALVFLRVLSTRDPDYAFLVWNLALAWVPFLIALGMYRGYLNRAPSVVVAVLGVLWLLFLPNAPYITTDFVHLQWSEGAPLWFDILAVTAYAATGLLLRFASLYLVQVVASQVLGARALWAMVVVVLWLSSIGIYLGRYQRLNSWDAVRHPHMLASMIRSRLGDPLANPTLLMVMVAFTAALTALYLVLYLMVTLVFPRDGADRWRANRGSR